MYRRNCTFDVTHHLKLDVLALHLGLVSEGLSIGSLGWTRTHAKRVERLAQAGIAPDRIARLHAPVGLDIGAACPAEIAESILAQMTQVLRQGG
jgi:Xanthine and CO dehydrogenases maturation factor, XdhC/CoxF family